MPRPYGCGSYNNTSRGHNNHDRHDGATRWGSATKDRDDSLSNFPGAKVQPGGWGTGFKKAVENGSIDMNFSHKNIY